MVVGTRQVCSRRAFLFHNWGDLLVACICGVDWPVPGKSELAGWSVEDLMNGVEDLTAPTGGGWVGATLGA